MNNQFAYLALGCFWGPDEFFSGLTGVVSTEVGYAGGTTNDPTYYSLGDHAETIKIEFDPQIISYEEILKHFFAQHDPTVHEIARYRSIILYKNNEQKETAERLKAETEKKLGRPIATEIKIFGKFYPAEEYHQKYFEKMKH